MCGELWHQCQLHFSIPLPVAREARHVVPRLRENRHSMNALATLDTNQSRHADLRFPPGPKLFARFGHLVAKPQATPLMPGTGTHAADAVWPAAAGASASADAAIEDAAGINNRSQSQGEDSTVGPECTDRDMSATIDVTPVFSTSGQKAPEQPGRSAKTHFRPFRIPR